MSESVAPLNSLHFMMTIDLLGKVLTNSEFTSKELKVSGGLVFLDGSTRLFLRLNFLIHEILNSTFERIRVSDPELDENTLRGLKYLMTGKIMSIIADRVVDSFSSPKLSAIYDEIFKSNQMGSGDKAFLTAALLDAGYERWSERWIAIAKRKPTQRLLIDFFADRLWSFMHRKAMDKKLRQKVEDTSVELQLSLVGSARAKAQ